MANYTKATNFATKDTLPTGDSGKIVKGTEIDSEFNAIASAVSSKALVLLQLQQQRQVLIQLS
jgi:hypothetical protein